jgi:hypothetical protein
VQVEVIHGLSSVSFAVDHEACAFFPAAFPNGKFLRLEKEAAQKARVCGNGFHDARNVPFGDYQEVNRGSGVNIAEGEEFIVFVDFL